jgi:hypothetical protein
MEIHRQNQEAQQIIERDHQEVRELLLRITRQKSALDTILDDNNDVVSVMQTIQEVGMSWLFETVNDDYIVGNPPTGQLP